MHHGMCLTIIVFIVVIIIIIIMKTLEMNKHKKRTRKLFGPLTAKCAWFVSQNDTNCMCDCVRVCARAIAPSSSDSRHSLFNDQKCFPYIECLIFLGPYKKNGSYTENNWNHKDQLEKKNERKKRKQSLKGKSAPQIYTKKKKKKEKEREIFSEV